MERRAEEQASEIVKPEETQQGAQWWIKRLFIETLKPEASQQ